MKQDYSSRLQTRMDENYSVHYVYVLSPRWVGIICSLAESIVRWTHRFDTSISAKDYEKQHGGK